MSNTFRKSKFIDFNEGSVIISPLDLKESTPKPWSLEDKINIFECRVEVWQLGVAVEILKEIEAHDIPSIWSHAGFSLISVAFSYFEMIGKSLNPNSRKSGTAGEDFNWGFCDVYKEYKPTLNSYKDKDISPDVVGFRDRVRNGLYHLAYPKKDVGIHNEDLISTKDFYIKNYSDVVEVRRVYWVNPHRMIRTIVDHFPTFIARLNDPSFITLHVKFEEFFDKFHDPRG
ncbi:MAG: hypothetical protein HC875_41690 [Anaerolineales bacterium]|nr:hypothetical protein [Anaerolineales bacterium]